MPFGAIFPSIIPMGILFITFEAAYDNVNHAGGKTCNYYIKALNRNKLNNVSGFLSMLTDDSGEIDTKTLIPEMIQSVMNTKPFIYHTEFLGDLEIGGGFIKLNIPMTNNQVVLGRNDLEDLKRIFNIV